MRRKRRKVIIAHPVKTREELEAHFGRTWDTAQLAQDFVITAIIDHTVVVVRRRSDDVVGTLQYQEGPPCLYYSFTEQPRDQ